MKNNRIISFMLVVVMLLSACGALSSCAKKAETGTLMVTYTNGKLYESEFTDWENYMVSYYSEEISSYETGEEQERALFIAQIYDEAVKYWTQVLIVRKALEKEGTVFTDQDIENEKAEILEEMNEVYESIGGWSGLKEQLELSDNFLNQYALAQLVQSVMQKFCLSRYPVTDEMIYNYYQNHTEDFLVAPAYTIDMIYVTVAEDSLGDKDAWAAAKEEAEGYLARIQNGESFDSVKADAIANAKDAKVAEAFSSESEINKSACAQYTDLDATLKIIDEQYEEYCDTNKVALVPYADPNGDADEYSVWFSYVNAINQVTVKNALLNLEDGDVYDGVIEHVYGYEIVKKVSTSSETYFRELDDEGVRDEIYDLVLDELWDDGAGIAVTGTLEALEEEYEVVYEYSYEDAVQARIDALNGTDDSDS